MSKFLQLKKQIATLEAEAEIARQSELQEAIAKAKQLIVEFSLTAEQLGFLPARQSAQVKTKKSKSVSPAKFRDPATGATWSGFGRRPSWMPARGANEASVSVSTAAAPKQSLPTAILPASVQPAKAPAAKPNPKTAKTTPKTTKPKTKKTATKKASTKKPSGLTPAPISRRAAKP